MTSKLLFATLLCVSVFSASARAEEKPFLDRLDVRTQVAVQYITEDNKDLNVSRRGRDTSLSEFIQTSVKAPFTENLTGFTNLRAINIDGDAGFDDESGRSISAGRSFLELRELWLRLDNVGGMPPWAVQAGRQRVREPRSLWWNADLDMVRVDYDTTLLKGFFGVGEDLFSYRSNNTEDYKEDDKDRFRALGELAWQYRRGHFLEGRALFENDHSGLEPVGAVIPASDRDNEDQTALWLGFRSAGLIDKPLAQAGVLKYRADLIGLAGDSDEITTAAGAPGFRVVNGAQSRSLRSWAFDGGATLTTELPLKPAFTLGYAHGSGDDNAADGTDHAFRQSDMHGAASRFGIERQAQKSFGEVLRPELSNLHIITAAVGVPVTDVTDVSVTYYNYRLSERATSLRSGGISVAMNGTDKGVGNAVDLGFNTDVDGMLKAQKGFVKDIDFRVTLGSFFAGEAYEPNSDKAAYRLFSELKFRF